MTTKIAKLREDIGKALWDKNMIHAGYKTPWSELVYKDHWLGLADAAIQAFHDAKGVMLVDNQVLPVAECPYPDDTNTALGFRVGMGKQARCMINADWRKVESLK